MCCCYGSLNQTKPLRWAHTPGKDPGSAYSPPTVTFLKELKETSSLDPRNNEFLLLPQEFGLPIRIVPELERYGTCSRLRGFETVRWSCFVPLESKKLVKPFSSKQVPRPKTSQQLWGWQCQPTSQRFHSLHRPFGAQEVCLGMRIFAKP